MPTKGPARIKQRTHPIRWMPGPSLYLCCDTYCREPQAATLSRKGFPVDSRAAPPGTCTQGAEWSNTFQPASLTSYLTTMQPRRRQQLLFYK